MKPSVEKRLLERAAQEIIRLRRQVEILSQTAKCVEAFHMALSSQPKNQLATVDIVHEIGETLRGNEDLSSE